MFTVVAFCFMVFIHIKKHDLQCCVFPLECSMTQLQIKLKSQPQGLSPSCPSTLLTQSHYFLPTLNLSVTLSIASSPCLGLSLCHSSSHSLLTHLSIIYSISVNHSALLALQLAASIDLHLLPFHHCPLPTYSSFSSLLHRSTFHQIIPHHFILSASVPHWALKKPKTPISPFVFVPHNNINANLLSWFYTLVFCHSRAFNFGMTSEGSTKAYSSMCPLP